MTRLAACWMVVMTGWAWGCNEAGSVPATAQAGSSAPPMAATTQAVATAGAPAQTATAAAGSGGRAAPSPATGGAGSAAAEPSQPATAGRAAAPVSADRLPCDVAAVVENQCQSCHGATPKLGAPMSLVTAADFQKPATSAPAKKVYELVHARVLDETNPMPPLSAAKLSATDKMLLADWSAQSAPALAPNAPDCTDDTPSQPPTTTQDPTPSTEDSKCYDLTVHGVSSANDSTPFMVPPGESYNCFYFDAPWTTPTESVAFKSKLDNEAALHHWFLYAMPSNHPNGTVEANCSPLHVDGPQMLAGWAPGGKDMVMPDGVSAEIAAPGTTLMLEWHYMNNGDAPLADKSTVSVCGVPAGTRPNTASITWLGTEDFGLGMPAHATTSVTGTCDPARKGLMTDAPIHLLYTIPHMHQYGTHLKLDIMSAAGGMKSVFDQPFSDKNQAFVETKADVLAGDQIVTTCTFNNTSDAAVGYGDPFGNGEMCYAFVLAYPAHALDNGTRSLLGANNSCL